MSCCGICNLFHLDMDALVVNVKLALFGVLSMVKCEQAAVIDGEFRQK